MVSDFIAVAILSIAACTHVEPPVPLVATPVSPAAEPVSAPVSEPSTPEPDPKLVSHAQALAAEGERHFRKGNYDAAEASLKKAITVYPFVAEANLTLGKIFLIKGSATRDVALIQSARLMFELAHQIDPKLSEPVLLLELFTEPAD